jgi:hypothetical protein
VIEPEHGRADTPLLHLTGSRVAVAPAGTDIPKGNGCGRGIGKELRYFSGSFEATARTKVLRHTQVKAGWLR